MLPELEEVLRTRWESFGSTWERPGRFLFVLSGERHPHSKAIFYCLPQGRSGQTVVVKIQKGEPHLPLLENEHQRLRALHGLEGLKGLEASIPRPLLFGEVAGHPVLIETYLPGIPFSKHARRRDPQCFLRVVDWLQAFHTRTRGAAVRLAPEEIRRYFLDPVEPAMRLLDGRRAVRSSLDAYRRRAEDLAGTPLPFVFGHNDLCLNNLRLQGDRLGVIDWEFSRYPDLPLADLLNAFLFFAMTWKRLSYPEAFRLAFSGDNPLAQLLRRCTREYCSHLGLSASLADVLVVQYLISRIPLLESIGNAAGREEALWCLEAVAKGQVDLSTWSASF